MNNICAVCIGFGCDDLHACAGGCSWIVVDYSEQRGVCGNCRPMMKHWDEGPFCVDGEVS